MHPGAWPLAKCWFLLCSKLHSKLYSKLYSKPYSLLLLAHCLMGWDPIKHWASKRELYSKLYSKLCSKLHRLAAGGGVSAAVCPPGAQLWARGVPGEKQGRAQGPGISGGCQPPEISGPFWARFAAGVDVFGLCCCQWAIVPQAGVQGGSRPRRARHANFAENSGGATP